MKILYFILALTCISEVAYSQPCTPDTSKHNSGIYPTGGTVDTVYAGIAYSESVTYVTLDDTTITVTINPAPPTSVTARLDSVAITNWSNPASLNLPPGLQGSCNTANCMLPGNSANCMRISGTVNNIADTGTYLLNLDVTYYFTILSSPFTGVKYSLPATYNPFSIVVKSMPAGKINFNSRVRGPELYPNPANDRFTIRGLSGSTISEIILYDISGQLIFSGTTDQNEFTYFWPDNMAPGMYFIHVISDGNSPLFYHVIKE